MPLFEPRKMNNTFKGLLNYHTIKVNAIKQLFFSPEYIIIERLKERREIFKDPIKITKIINRACRSRHMYEVKKKRQQ